jgi:hypothetical protein
LRQCGQLGLAKPAYAALPSRLLEVTYRRFEPMTEDDLTDEISDIEDRIEALAEIAERCRKYILASKIAIGGGAALLLVTILGVFGFGQTATLASIALVLGGIVSLGSNISTLRQADDSIRAAEALRAQLISRIDLRVVEDTPMKLV